MAIGLPLWGQAGWLGDVFAADARPADLLAQYAERFDAVEGNTTFYGVPSTQTVDRWRRQTPEAFTFCFKFPREITHDAGLRGVGRASTAFLERLAPLGDRLGPLMVQLPAAFGPDELPSLERFLDGLPTDFRCAVEVRHAGYFARDASLRLEEALAARDVDRVIMDTRPMGAGDATDPDVVGAAHAKPDVPVRAVALAARPLLRLVAHPTAAVNAPWFAFWAARAARWVRRGRRPLVFMHCPNNDHSPGLARRFDRLVRARLAPGVAPLPGPRARREEAVAERDQLTLL